MSLLVASYLVAGLMLLVAGAEALVRGASRLAIRLGIAPLIVGLTIVALGTSSPETAIGLQASLSGRGDLAVGNALGSNIANILLILGLCALVAPLLVSRQLIRLDIPVMLATGGLAYLLAHDGRLSHGDGALLLLAMLGYSAFLVFAARHERRHAAAPPPRRADTGAPGWLAQVPLILLGLGLLVVGSRLLVEGASSLARAFGLSELVIGLTVVAVGTSLPELATSLLAVLRGQRDIAVGNVVGSSIYNLTLVLGSAASLAPGGLSISPNALAFDFPVMLAVFAACLPIFFSGYCINRWEGLLFFGYYLAYCLYLVLFAAGLGALELLRHAMTWYVLPLTATTLAVIFLRAWKRRH
ncbi:calcium/sodium antiporter [Pseudomonas oligotrophica]|uniref:calcium/sodium antiporter n=1 Tax=Pseudomonas oligotrophica TaxID=2912055 RepID=UPI001F00EAE7|nr:calcium/sodium antiporter [Pseudomonas oligotrophica]